MRLICGWRQRELAGKLIRGEPIQPDSFLAKHLAQCAECARARQDYALLNEALPNSSPAPSLSAGFDAKLRSRLHAEAQARLQSATNPTLAQGATKAARIAACTALAAIGIWVLWIGPKGLETAPTVGIIGTLPNKPSSPSVSQLSLKKPAGRLPVYMVNLRIKHSHGPKHHANSRIITARKGRKVHRYLSARIHLSHRIHPLAKALRRRSRSASPEGGLQTNLSETSVNISATWRDAGETYETLGDYSRASGAYATAFETDPDAELAISASVNAERAGDKSQALELIAEALK